MQPRATPYQRMPRLRRLVFTLNNWTQDQYSHMTSTAVTAKMRWMIIAKETGDSGTPHLQGACVLLTQMAFSTVKTLFGCPTIHLEAMKGKPEHSLAYCSKQDSNPFVYGVLPTQGKRNDLHNITKRLREGESLSSLAQDDEGAEAIIKYHKGLTVLSSLLSTGRRTPPKVFWIYGPTGVGKTKCCFEWGEKLGTVWISPGGLKWFDGYNNHKSVIFDDFRAKGVHFPFFLRLLDRYPLRVEFKGGFVEWLPEFIFITTPNSPEVTFSKRKEHIPEDINQLNRRITRVYSFPEDIKKFERYLTLQCREVDTADVTNLDDLSIGFDWDDQNNIISLQ